eukprot:425978-Prorocentrum_minimum.AAC.2
MYHRGEAFLSVNTVRPARPEAHPLAVPPHARMFLDPSMVRGPGEGPEMIRGPEERDDDDPTVLVEGAIEDGMRRARSIRCAPPRRTCHASQGREPSRTSTPELNP